MHRLISLLPLLLWSETALGQSQPLPNAYRLIPIPGIPNPPLTPPNLSGQLRLNPPGYVFPVNPFPNTPSFSTSNFGNPNFLGSLDRAIPPPVLKPGRYLLPTLIYPFNFGLSWAPPVYIQYVQRGTTEPSVIFVQPLPPPPPPPTPPEPKRPYALFTFHMPEKAEVYVDGRKMTMLKGPTAVMRSPNLFTGSGYSYLVRIVWQEGGREVEHKQLVLFSAGSEIDIFAETPAK